MSKIIFTENAWDDYIYWQQQDKKTIRKINSLLKISNGRHSMEKASRSRCGIKRGIGADESMTWTGLFTESLTAIFL